MNTAIAALETFPEQLARIYEEVPKEYVTWIPDSWEGIPSETFTPIEQVCHIRDIEIDGYHVRFRRMLEETNPLLISIDSYSLARERNYAAADPYEALSKFKTARRQTVQIIRELSEAQINRTGSFEGYGQLTVRALIHYLCSHDQQHFSGMHWLLGKIDSHR